MVFILALLSVLYIYYKWTDFFENVGRKIINGKMGPLMEFNTGLLHFVWPGLDKSIDQDRSDSLPRSEFFSNSNLLVSESLIESFLLGRDDFWLKLEKKIYTFWGKTQFTDNPAKNISVQILSPVLNIKNCGKKTVNLRTWLPQQTFQTTINKKMLISLMKWHECALCRRKIKSALTHERLSTVWFNSVSFNSIQLIFFYIAFPTIKIDP